MFSLTNRSKIIGALILIVVKLIYKEQIIVDELRKKTKNKVFSVEKTSRKCLDRLLPSLMFYL